MKRAAIVLMVSTAIIMMLGLVPACAPKAPVEKISLTAISPWKPDQWMTKFFIEKFIPELNRRAPGGRLEVKYVGGPEIIKDADQLVEVGKGSIDMMYGYSGFVAGVLPEISIITLPAVERTRENFLKIAWAIKEPLGEVMAKKTNTKLLAIHGPIIMSLNTRKEPLTSLDDLKKLKTRVTGGWDEVMIKALGGIPTKIPSGEIYTAAERGVIDAASRPISAVHSWREYEVWKYITPLPMYQIDGYMVMNLDVFNRLPADLQKFLVDFGKEWDPKWVDYYIKCDDEVLAELVRLGMKVVELSPADAAKYKKTQIEAALEWFPKVAPENHKTLIEAMKAAVK